MALAFALIALIDCILCIENIAVQLLLLLTLPSLPSHCLIKTHLGFLSYHRSHVQLIPFQVWHLVSPLLFLYELVQCGQQDLQQLTVFSDRNRI